MHRFFILTIAFCLILGSYGTNPAPAAEPPSTKLALSFKPKQSDVEYDIPKQADHAKCKVTVVRKGKASGWVVMGPGGETLRRFMDTDGDNIVDHWGYYLRGLEVYRDIDSDADNKIDQFRWMNSAGSRWGIDNNSDGFVDSWKVISAEEASREAVKALISGNIKILQPLLLGEEDIASLGIPPAVSKQLLEQTTDAADKLRKNQTAAKGITSKTQWLQFINSIPASIPAEQVGAEKDLLVYENAMATVETGSQTALIQIGEMVRVGEGWKIAGIPQLMDQNSVQVGGILMHPAIAETANPPVGSSSEDPDTQKLIEQLQELDKNSPALTASRSEMSKYYSSRAVILTELRIISKTEELREQWTQQLTDGLAAGAQTGVYPEGLDRLKKLEEDVSKPGGSPETLAYVAYRKMLAEYNVAIREADNEKRNEIQENWQKDLETFVQKHPKSQDAPEAIIQIAIADEYNNKVEEAVTWYRKLTSEFPEAASYDRAAGAVRRIELEGKPLELSGQGFPTGTVNSANYRGKVLAVIYWATWCKPCTEELPQLRELYEKYHDTGFEIIGVNLDNESDVIAPYLKQHKVTWPQIHEPGGLVESPPAKKYGIIIPPTIFLVDRTGKVVKRNAKVEDLKTMLPDLLEGKPSQLGAGSGSKDSKTN